MSEPSASSDHNLLFAVLALQADFLTQARFVDACTLWASQKDSPIARILVERGWLTPDEQVDIDRLLERKLKKHGGSARAGLADVAGDENVRRSLAAVPDVEIRGTLAGVTPSGHVLLATTEYTPQEGERYTVTRLHATGGLGRVWLARDAALGRDVALKDLRPERAANPAVWGRFLREARVTGQLEHPGIVPIYELARRPENGQPFYTMRFVRGRTLREAITAYHQRRQRDELGRLDQRELLTAFVGVCNAIAYAHSRGVIHRDLKPANVVLGEFGEVMVLDWGLAKSDGAAPETEAESENTDGPLTTGDDPPIATLEGQVLGTPAYMAPEQADGRLADMDARTDVYGLGAILYELLTGRPPFTGEDTEEVLSQVRTLAPDRPRDLVSDTPRALEAVCLKALAKRPDDRYPATNEMADDVRHFLADEPITAYPEPLAARAWRWGRRHRTLVCALVAVLVVAVPILFTGVVLLDQSHSRERHARVQEEAARKDEQAARERAQANYQRTLRAADALAEELARGIRPIAGTQSKTVIAILDRAKSITDDLFADSEDSPDALHRKARLLGQFSELYQQTNHTTRARQSAEQSLALFDRLLAARPDDRNLQVQRAKARYRLADVLVIQMHHDDAHAAFQATAAELKALDAESDPALAAGTLAGCYTYDAQVLTARGDHNGAERSYKRGLDLRRKALATVGDDSHIRTQIALSLQWYGLHVVRHRSQQHEEGLRLLREGRDLMRAACALDPWDANKHHRLVAIISILAESAYSQESAECVAELEKIVDRFVRHDPDNDNWQRENLRLTYIKVASKLKAAGQLDAVALAELRRAEKKMNEEVLTIIIRRNTQDPENYLWLADRASSEFRLADFLVRLAAIEPQNAADHAMKVREFATASIKHNDQVLARCPMNPSVESIRVRSLLQLAEAERIAADVPKSWVFRWEYQAAYIEHSHRFAAAYPADPYWILQVRRAYFGLLAELNSKTKQPSVGMATRPELVASFLKVASAVADCSDEVKKQAVAWHDQSRRLIADTLRDFEGMGLLPPDGKKLLDRLSQLEKKP